MKTNLDFIAADDTQQRSPFLEDVLHGLSKPQKTLACKWFYDEVGSALFEEITQLPEYYLTQVETRLLEALKSDLTNELPNLTLIVEPGSGSSNKTRILLGSQPNLKEYVPIDISAEFLATSAAELKQEFEHLDIRPLVGDFTDTIKPIAAQHHAECLIFFPGSTIGNFDPIEGQKLLRKIRHIVDRPSWLLIGVDMTQDRSKLLAAYNDAAGVTARFNLNLLARINRELEADFNLASFSHRAVFNADEHRIEMHLVSECAQEVRIAGQKIHFRAGEFIHTENCYKYPRFRFEALLSASGWHVRRAWQDQTTSGFGLFLLKSEAT